MGNSIFSFTRRDYENSRKEGLSKIPQLTNYKWTDLNAGDPGVVLLDYVHALVDMCNFYMDHQALEAFLSTAKERQNLFHLAKQISYNIRSAKGALADIKVAVLSEDNGFPKSDDEKILIPKGTTFNSEKGPYRTLEDLLIEDANYTYEVPCQQCELVTDVYVGTGISSQYKPNIDEDYDDGMPDEDTNNPFEDQTYTLTAKYPDIDSIEIVGQDGTLWEKVDFIALSSPGNPSYECDLNTDSTITIKFGNNLRGKTPELNEVLNISYLSSNGEDGKLSPYDINLKPSFISNLGNSYIVYVYNDTESTGGSKGEDDEELRINALAYAKTQGRSVTNEDFRSMANMVDGVKDVRVYDIHNAPDYCANHEVKVIVMPEDSTTDNSALIREVTNHLWNTMIPPTNLYVSSPKYQAIDIVIIAKRRVLGLSEDNTEDEMKDIIDAYFDDLNIGEDYNSFDLLSRLYQLQGLKSIISITPSSYEASISMKLILGNLDIEFQ